jgi:predicted NBD/HSP70 family sugar kinase
MAGNFFLDKIAFHTKQIAWPLFMENLPILPAKLQNDAGIIGAASLILEEEK